MVYGPAGDLGLWSIHGPHRPKLGAECDTMQSFHDLIKGLLTSDPTERLGNLKSGADDVKRHPFFKKIVWHSLLLKKIEAPYKPQIASALDASNFESFEDPDKGQPLGRNAFPRNTYAEFSKLCQDARRASQSSTPGAGTPPRR